MSKDLKSIVAQVKSAYTISDYIRNSGVKLTPSGAGKWKGICSFHNEKTPSFTVSDSFQNYRCWGCGANGDLLKYVMETEHLEFMEALKKLAEDKGIELELKEGEQSIDYKQLRACLRAAAVFFVKEFRKLPEDHAAKLQVSERGLSEKTVTYGYAPENRTALHKHLTEAGFSDEIQLQAGVVRLWEKGNKIFDFWSGRLMFIITDSTGKPIGFSGRKLFESDQAGKYVNSQASALFDKSSALFNIQHAKEKASKDSVVLVAEGQFDVAAFMEAGASNVVASSGTAFTRQQGAILQRLVGDSGKIVFAFDGDEAGAKAAVSVFKNIPSLHTTAWVLQLPPGEDPCDYRLKHGNEALVELIDKAIPLVSFVLEVAKKRYAMETEIGRSQYLDYASTVIATIGSGSLRESFIRAVALDVFADVDTIKALVAKSKPMEFYEQAEEKQEQEIPEELKLNTSEELVKLIQEDELYELTARCLALSVLDRKLVKYLPKVQNVLPQDFHKFIEELIATPEEQAVIPEAFDDSALVVYLSRQDLFPYITLEAFDSKEQFTYLLNRYSKTKKERAQARRQEKIHSVLISSKANEIELLEKALQIKAGESDD